VPHQPKRWQRLVFFVAIRGLGFGAPDTIRTYDLGFRKALRNVANYADLRCRVARARGVGGKEKALPNLSKAARVASVARWA
jgi:hypothetical protein